MGGIPALIMKATFDPGHGWLARRYQLCASCSACLIKKEDSIIATSHINDYYLFLPPDDGSGKISRKPTIRSCRLQSFPPLKCAASS